MAKVNHGLISGKVGSLVYYVVNGQQMVRGRAIHIKVSQKAAKQNKIFRTATKIGSGIRSSLSTHFPTGYNGPVNNSITSRLCAALKSQWNERTQSFDLIKNGFETLDDFQFEPKVIVEKFFNPIMAFSLDGTSLTVALDEIEILRDIVFAKGSLKCDVVIGLSTLQLTSEPKITSFADNRIISIKKTDVVIQPPTLIFNAPPASLCIITMFLRFYDGGKNTWNLINSRSFNPGKILKAVYTPAESLPIIM